MQTAATKIGTKLVLTSKELQVITSQVLEALKKNKGFILEGEASLDLSNANDAATKKDLKILELKIQKEIADNKNELLEKIHDTNLKIEQLRTEAIENKNDTDLKIEQLRTELIEKIAETKNELQKEIHNTKTELIKWMVTMQIGGFTATVLTLFALLKIFLPS